VAPRRTGLDSSVVAVAALAGATSRSRLNLLLLGMTAKRGWAWLGPGWWRRLGGWR
jgi:hypothetical protein